MEFFQLFFPIEFNNVRNNQRRVEVRFLHAKLAHFLRKIILHPSINSGTYHTFRGEENFHGPPIVQHLQVAVNLDKDLEHNDFPISKTFLEKAVSEIISFVDFLTMTH